MDSTESNGNGASDALPPPPPVIPPNVVQLKAEPETGSQPIKKAGPKRVPMGRQGLASGGQKTQLLTNHFQVNVTNKEGQFFRYSRSSTLMPLLIFNFSLRFCASK